MPIKVGNRAFAPRPFTTLLTIVLIALLVSLGRWQLHRADEKRVLFDSFAAGGGAAHPIDLNTPKLPRYSQVEAAGHYDDYAPDLDRQHGQCRTRRIFRDHALCAARRRLGAGQSRLDSLRARAAPIGRPFRSPPIARRIRGRADNLPSPGIRMGVPAPLTPPYPVVASFPTQADIAQLLKETALDLRRRLDPARSG